MDTTVLKILLIATAVAMPAWMVWRKSRKRPWLAGWLLVVGLLILPYGLTVWLHPEWLAHPVPFLAKHLVILPAFFSLAALVGGLAPLALALILVIGKAFGEAFKDVEWRQDEEEEDSGYSEYVDPLGKDWVNDWKYSYYRQSFWDDD